MYFFEFCFWKDPPHAVNWSLTHSTGFQTLFFTDISVTVAQIQKIQKTRCIFFEFCFWEDPLHPVNWSLTHSTGPQTLFFADISVMVTQIKKIKKTRCIFYRIMLLGGPSPPSQLVPNPLNWSPNTVFCKYLSNGHSNKKNSKYEVHLLFNYASGRTLSTQSTGP